MAKKKQPTVDTSADVPAVMAAMMSVNPVLAKAWTDIMSESARFMTERLKTDLETQKALMACKNARGIDGGAIGLPEYGRAAICR
jgi:hypothetical protein